MRRVLSALLALAMFLACQPLSVAAIAQNLGEIAGISVVEGKPLNNITVRLRNVGNGSLVGDMRTNELGQFRFTGLSAGNYVVETVAPNGTMLGTSTRIALDTGRMVATGVTVTTSAASAAAVGVGGAAGAAGAAGGGAGAAAAGAGAAGAAAGQAAAGAGGGFLTTTAGIVTAVAVGAGVTAAIVAVTNNASASGG